MSLLRKDGAFSVGDYIFVAVGLLCLFWFFLSYSAQEPRSTIKTKLSEHAAGIKANGVLEELGYSFNNQSEFTTSFQNNPNLLDSLQYTNSRQGFIRAVSDSMPANLHPYFWEVRFSGTNQEEMQFENESEVTAIRLDEEGHIIEFLNPQNTIPSNPVHREALVSAFNSNFGLELWQSKPDSVWGNILRFDPDTDYNNENASDVEADVEQSHTYNQENIASLATFYLQDSGWDMSALELTEIQIETVHSQSVADVSFATAHPVMGQDASITLRLLPTGALLSLDATYNQPASEQPMPGILGIARGSALLIFGIALIILFYFRIRLRAIDTQSSLIVGILVGLIASLTIFLQQWGNGPLLTGDIQTMDLLMIALQMGLAGAFTAVFSFALFAVGDSLMRQHWSEKLYSYNYLRQGMFFNRPIGEMILRSMVLAFILCGIWTTALSLFPDLFFEIKRTFITYEAAWPGIYAFLTSIWSSLFLTLIVFAVAAAQVYGLYSKKWLASLMIVLGVILMGSTFQEVNPPIQETIFFGILGITFVAIFLKWDLLTVFFTGFLFVMMLEVSTGWLVENSPDLYVFLAFCVFILLSSVVGILAVVKGKERKSLPSFVPEYVEEMAQEQRIKQELQIARKVQQSFLPVQTPEFDQLELAAICKPAFETGGDYYDFVHLSDHRIAVMVGDVSGKGIQAAFYMTFVKGVIHSLCREIDSPAEVLKKTNHLFCENAPKGTFISLVYGIMDLKSQTFTFARAGHNPILKADAQKGEVEELRPNGIGIGLARDGSFEKQIEEMKLSLCENDLLILYTDGIVEALNEQGLFYGTNRLNDIVNRNTTGTAKNILVNLTEDVHSFIGNAKQHDDMTVVVMKLKNTNEN